MNIALFLHFYPWDFAKAPQYAENHHDFEDSLNNQYNLTLLLSHLLFLDIWFSDYVYVGWISSLFCGSLSSYCFFSFPHYFISFWVHCQIFCVVVIVDLRQTGLTWNVGASVENLPPSDNLWTHLWGSFLTGDWCRQTQHSVNCTFAGESAFCKKGSWSRAHESKKARRATAWSLPWFMLSCSCLDPTLTSFIDELWPGSKSWMKSIKSQVTFGQGINHNYRKHIRTSNLLIFF